MAHKMYEHAGLIRVSQTKTRRGALAFASAGRSCVRVLNRSTPSRMGGRVMARKRFECAEPIPGPHPVMKPTSLDFGSAAGCAAGVLNRSTPSKWGVK